MPSYSYILVMISEFMLTSNIGNVKHGQIDNVGGFGEKDIALMYLKSHADMEILNTLYRINKSKLLELLHCMKNYYNGEI